MASDKPGDGILAPENGSRTHTCRRAELRPPEKIGAWRTVFRRGFLRLVDQPHAPRNLRSPAGEELTEKVGRKKSPAARRFDGDEVVRRVSEGE